MKKLLLSVWTLCCAVTGLAQVSFGHPEQLNDNWLFLRADSSWNIYEKPEMKDPQFDDSRWQRITLPHDWGVEQPMSPDKGSCQGYLPGGIAWYRRHLRLTPPLRHDPPSEKRGECTRRAN